MPIICRLCALEKTYQVPIFDDECCTILTKIENCVRIQVQHDDYLPKTICKQCLSKLNSFNEFLLACSESQIILNKLYEKLDTLPQERHSLYVIQEESCIEDVPEDSNNPYESELEERSPNAIQEEICIRNNCSEDSNNLYESELEDDLVVEVLVDENIEENDLISTSTTNREYENEGGETSITNYREYEDEEGEQEEEIVDCDNISDVEYGGFLEVHASNSGKSSVKSGPQFNRNEFRQLECCECNFLVRGAKQMEKHFLIKHGRNAIFKCPECGKIFERYRSYTRHVLAHVEKPKFACEICNKTFAQKINLKNHMVSHGDEINNYECEQCGKLFKHASSVYKHFRTHFGVKISCGECGEKFVSEDTLRNHMKAIHLKEKNESCPVCGKSYATKQALYYHTKIHETDITKKSKCQICSKYFATSSSLKRHLLSHSITVI